MSAGTVAQWLAWYDLLAPVGESSTVWTVEQAASLHCGAVQHLVRAVGRLCRRAFRERWVDAQPRPGKSDGAFCLIVFKDGRIEADGKLEILLSTCAEVQRLWASDLGVAGALAAHVGG